MDTSKQAASAGLTHCFNLAASVFISRVSPKINPCTWYFLNVLGDVTFTTFLSFSLLKLVEEAFSSSSHLKFKTGVYGEQPSWCSYTYQLIIWLCIVFLAKLCMLGSMVLFGIPLNSFGDMCLSTLKPYPRLELIMVMVVVPVILNSLMFWITDSYLKHTLKDTDEETSLSLDKTLRYDAVSKA
jgi:hypothetical protein